MKQYKHKGTEAIFNKSINGKSYYSDKYEGYYIPSELVENSCDYEEVIEKDYQILKEMYSNVFAQIKHKIISVKRLSDGEVFSLNDKAKLTAFGGCVDTIEEINLVDSKIYLRALAGTWNQELKDVEKVKEPLFISFDGEKIFEDTVVFVPQLISNTWKSFLEMKGRDVITKSSCVLAFAKKENAEEYIKTYKNYKTADGSPIVKGQTFYLYDDKWFKCLEGKFGGFKSDKWVGKRYKTKEEVEELILMNKPCLSLNELLDAWGERGNREYYVKSPMFYSFRKFVEKKLGNL